MSCFAGIDFGGMSVKVGLFDGQARLLCKHTAATSKEDGYAKTVKKTVQAVRDACAKAQVSPAALPRGGRRYARRDRRGEGLSSCAGAITAGRTGLLPPTLRRGWACPWNLPTMRTPRRWARRVSARAKNTTAASCSRWARASAAASSWTARSSAGLAAEAAKRGIWSSNRRHSLPVRPARLLRTVRLRDGARPRYQTRHVRT